MKPPPYTIPDADKDLWDCGVTPAELLMRRQKACCACKKPFTPRNNLTYHCPACLALRGRLDYIRRKVVQSAPRESIVLTEDQVHRLDKAIRPRLRLLGRRLAKPINPADGFRLVGFPFVGVRRVLTWVSGYSNANACHDALHKVVVETHKGAAWEWIHQQAGLKP